MIGILETKYNLYKIKMDKTITIMNLLLTSIGKNHTEMS